MAVSKRLRFEILRRDNHACRYCGRCAPEVKLTVDHVTPETLGGSDDPSNLVAACAECNGGKSSVPADAALVADVSADAFRWAAAMRQAAEELADKDEAMELVLDAVQEAWKPFWLPADWAGSVVTFIHAGLDQEALLSLVAVAYRKRGLDSGRWSYFCGCCWKRIRQLQDRAHVIVTGQIPNSQTAPLSTVWTAAEVEEFESDAIDQARELLGEDRVGRLLSSPKLPPCRHGVVRHCGDPVCVIEDSALLIVTSERLKEFSDRDDAVMTEAEALIDG